MQVRLFDLPENSRVGLKEKFLREVINKTIPKAGNQYKLADIISHRLRRKFSRGSISTWLSKDNPALSVGELKVIANYINLNRKFLEQNLIFIKGTGRKAKKIFFPKIPFTLNEDLMNIMGHLFGDGGIHGLYFSPWYSNKDESLLFNFLIRLSSIGICEVTVSHGKNDVMYYWCPQILGLILMKFGLSFGDKLKNNWSIPPYFFGLNAELISSFIRALFDDDGTVSISKREIRLFSQNQLILRQVSKLLIRFFNIRTSNVKILSEKISKKENKIIIYYISITCKENFKKFHYSIGFDSVKKQQRLEKLIGGE